ncbi:MAG: FtsL-like putative cell division protein [Bacteroidales bacterium]|nr:FtsL-like putative cell division protein [Bacteroidales bacterium]
MVFTERLFLFLVIAFILSIFYINNRYVCQWKLIEINRLQSELKETKRNARARLSELMGDSRKSLVEEQLKLQGSELLDSKCSTYIIHDVN